MDQKAQRSNFSQMKEFFKTNSQKLHNLPKTINDEANAYYQMKRRVGGAPQNDDPRSSSQVVKKGDNQAMLMNMKQTRTGNHIRMLGKSNS
jgi:hypothetical protein